MGKIIIFDTTLRDGTQGANISFSSEEKLMIAHRLDDFGVHYIEGGWPGSNPKDQAFFDMAKKETFKTARLTAFSATRRPGIKPEDDLNLKMLIDAQTPAVAIFGKSWDLHVTKVMNNTLEENLAMIRDSIEFLKRKDREVIYDAEQFFDGYKENRQYALQTLCAAVEGGADYIVLCDTNGGTLTFEIESITSDVCQFLNEKYNSDKKNNLIKIGIHTHNDCGHAVANSIAAIRKGAIMVQGTINGFGERTGNADLTSIIPILMLKMNLSCIPEENLTKLRELAVFVSETANLMPDNSRPFVGKNAFAHKAGVHVNAMMKVPRSYEHMAPELVGNRRRVVISDLSGKSNIEYKAQELGIELQNGQIDSRKIIDEIKKLEHEGYQFDKAEGSFQVLLDTLTNNQKPFYEFQSFRITIEKEKDKPSYAHAVVKVDVDGQTELVVAEGYEPVRVLDRALKKALKKYDSQIDSMHPVDFNVRLLNWQDPNAPRARVIMEMRDENHSWSTMGVGDSIIEASWLALTDGYYYKLHRKKQD